MTTWILIIALGCNGFGCGTRERHEFPSEASCYQALSNMHLINAAKLAGGSSQNQAAAYCVPKQVKL